MKKRRIYIVVTIVGCVVLAGCQTHPYSKIEDKVYNFVDKFSREIPKEFVTEEPDACVVRDPGLDIPKGGKGRIVTCSGSSDIQVYAGYLDVEDIGDDSWQGREINPDSAVIFSATFGGTILATDIYDIGDKDGLYMVEAVIICVAGKKGVWYFRKDENSDWRKCQLELTGLIDINKDHMKACVYDAEIVPTEQVQRYIDLAERFYNTYSCMDER